jgi:cytochrome c
MRNRIVLVALLALAATAARADGPDLGRPATADEIARWDISIGPDGRGLPPGSGTARDGAAVYAQHCAACHGADATGKPNDALVGGQGTLVAPQTALKTVGSYWPYATTLFDYVRRAMPLPAPHSLSDTEVYAVVAYLLQRNGVIGETDVVDARSLPTIKMPNRDSFVPRYPAHP